MILAHGIQYESDSEEKIIKSLPSRLEKTLSKDPITSDVVISACNRLSKRIQQGEFLPLLMTFLKKEQIQQFIDMLSEEYLYYRLNQELKMQIHSSEIVNPPHQTMLYYRQLEPLGVLFHIAAGNMEGLPAYSVIEGLLTCNINLVKLPGADQGITVHLLLELIKEEPKLADYIYVFDIPSTNIKAMKTLADLSNAIVIWGGDQAIQTVRELAKPNTKIIEWGHKISFAYLAKGEINQENMTQLAHHILSTKQLLCSSCQGIYLDTDDFIVVAKFAKQFFKLLLECAKSYPEVPIGVRAQVTLQQYNKKLENKKEYVLKRNGISITISKNSELEGSYTYGNLWIKPLPRRNIVHTLRKHTGHLQTVGICCEQGADEEITKRLIQAGVTRITSIGAMSDMLGGETHDGEFSLSRYVRMVEIR